MKAKIPKMKSIGIAHPAWKIQIVRRNSSPRLGGFGAGDASVAICLADASSGVVAVVASPALADDCSAVVMVLEASMPQLGIFGVQSLSCQK
jgi:hypothetical protein